MENVVECCVRKKLYLFYSSDSIYYFCIGCTDIANTILIYASSIQLINIK